jgi:hypothetical protein
MGGVRGGSQYNRRDVTFQRIFTMSEIDGYANVFELGAEVEATMRGGTRQSALARAWLQYACALLAQDVRAIEATAVSLPTVFNTQEATALPVL